jgi:hypothetical protein
MTASKSVPPVLVDYQRARHAAAGRRRKADAAGAEASGAAEVVASILTAGLVLVACLAAEDPLAERATPVSVGAAGLAMGSRRPPGEPPRAAVGAAAVGRSAVRR